METKEECRVKKPDIKKVERIYSQLMDELFFNWRDDTNSKDTPKRVAKMLVEESYRGLYSELPKLTVFNNTGKYDGVVFVGNIEVHSMCAHHHVPFLGKCHLAYIPKKTGCIIGTSKLNRIVDHFSRRPQVQETLTMQIHDFIQGLIGDNLGVAVMIEAQHLCVKVRGVKQDSIMKTAKLSGYFLEKNNNARTEFYDFIKQLKI